MVTLKDIAAEAGVSITTVSNVVHKRANRVSPEMVAKIWAIMEREHYVPSMTARTLANADSSIIGMITHMTPQNVGSTMSDPFLGTFVDGIERRTRENGYFLMIRSVEDARALESISRSWHLSGLILTGMFQDEFFECVEKLGTPFVLIDSYIDRGDVYSIGLEDEKGKRLIGYRRALAEFGVPYDPALVFTQEISVEEGRRLGHVLSEKKEITGIFASADILAAGIMTGLREKGVCVPRDKSIVGFDDNYLSQLTNPTLTTVHQDAERKGMLAADMILARVRGEAVENRSVILPVSLVERESVRRL